MTIFQQIFIQSCIHSTVNISNNNTNTALSMYVYLKPYRLVDITLNISHYVRIDEIQINGRKVSKIRIHHSAKRILTVFKYLKSFHHSAKSCAKNYV